MSEPRHRAYQIAGSCGWDHMVVVRAEDRSGCYYVLGFDGVEWRLALRTARGGTVPFDDGGTEQVVCRGVGGECDLEVDGDEGLLLVSVPVSGGDNGHAEVIKDVYSQDGGQTWAPFLS